MYLMQEFTSAVLFQKYFIFFLLQVSTSVQKVLLRWETFPRWGCWGSEQNTFSFNFRSIFLTLTQNPVYHNLRYLFTCTLESENKRPQFGVCCHSLSINCQWGPCRPQISWWPRSPLPVPF